MAAPHVKTNAKAIQVERMVACGLGEDEISYVLGCSAVELRAHYSQQLEMGLAATIARVGNAQIKAALRGDSNAAQFFLRSRARWVTPTKIEQDVTVTVEDKRKLIDEIATKVHKLQHRAPVTLEHEKQLEQAKPAGRAN